MIGILSRVRAEAVVAMLGALRAGVKYVPMNTLAPANWLGNVVKGAELDLLLVDSAFMHVAEELRSFGIKKILCIDEITDVELKPDVQTFKEIKSLAPYERIESKKSGAIGTDLEAKNYKSSPTILRMSSIHQVPQAVPKES